MCPVRIRIRRTSRSCRIRNERSNHSMEPCSDFRAVQAAPMHQGNDYRSMGISSHRPLRCLQAGKLRNRCQTEPSSANAAQLRWSSQSYSRGEDQVHAVERGPGLSNTDVYGMIEARSLPFSASSANKHRWEITISIERRSSAPSALISIGNGKRSSSARKESSVRTQRSYSTGAARYLQAFQKVRDCSHIHDHLGTSAKIQVSAHVVFDRVSEKRLCHLQLTDDRSTKKLQRKEAYLSLYWS